jgi:hypothetical protein
MSANNQFSKACAKWMTEATPMRERLAFRDGYSAAERALQSELATLLEQLAAVEAELLELDELTPSPIKRAAPALQHAITKAREDERERCAKVCEGRSLSLMQGGQAIASNEAGKCGRIIRALPAEPAAAAEQQADAETTAHDLREDYGIVIDQPVQYDGTGAAAPRWTQADETMLWLNEVELLGRNGPSIKLRAALLKLIEESLATRAVVEALHKEPLGCAFCDSGKLRNPSKGHEPGCGFALADVFMAAQDDGSKGGV